MKRLGILTSGGDAPGMNAAIRAVVRKAIYNNLDVIGIKRGYSGLVNAEFEPLLISSVGDIIHRGGTILHTARSQEFHTPEGRNKAWKNLRDNSIDGLVVIGGDGSFRGAHTFSKEFPINVIGIPGTIDNDIPCTDYSLGFDTCVNTVLDAINKIRDTATSHDRVNVIEVMGRHAGFIALEAGLAGGAESILIPEIPFSIEEICKKINRGVDRGKQHSIIVVAEGAASGYEVAKSITNGVGLETRVTILGHIQRGGAPTAFDRLLASKMGAKAVDLLQVGVNKCMIGINSGKLVTSDFEKVFSQKKSIDLKLFELANILSI